MTEFVKCGRCGTVYDKRGTHGTTVVNGYCPMCGLHHSGTHSIVYPVLKPSPLAAKPVDVQERTCHAVPHGYCIANGEKSSCRCWSCSECSYGWHVSDYDRQYRYCPNCGARVMNECIAESHDCGDGVTGLYCSGCGNYIDENDNYCPNCGAKVVGK